MNNKKSGMKLESNIDSIIAEFANFRELLIDIRTSGTDTRKALLNGSVNKNLIIEYLFEQIYIDMHRMTQANAIRPTREELIEAASNEPMTY